MNTIDFVLLLLIALAVFFAARQIRQKRKTGCTCGCADCGKACPLAKKK